MIKQVQMLLLCSGHPVTNKFEMKPSDLQSLLSLLEDNFVFFVIVYLSFLLDNVLLTVVVPIIPDYLFSNNFNISSEENDQYFGLSSLSPLQRKFETLEDDNGPLGALLASKAFVQLAFTPLVGYLVGVVGFNTPLLIGSCNMLLASLLFAYGNSYVVLVLARALHGSSSAAVAVCGMSILAKKLPNNVRTKFMPLTFGGIALGVLIGYPLGGAAYQMLGKAAPFLVIAFFIIINIALQMKYLKKEQPEPELETIVPAGSCYNECLSLLKDKSTLIVILAISICTSSMAILEPCVPMWLLASLQPPPTKWQLGAVFIPDSFGYFIGSHFAGFLPVLPWRTALSAMVLTSLSCCSIPLANSISQLTIPHFGIGLGVGAVDAALVPLLATLVDTRGSSQYGTVYALQQASVAVSYSLGPLLGGQAVHFLGFPWLMRIVGFMNLLVCPLLLELEVRKENTSIKNGNCQTYSSLEDGSSTQEEK